ncbi:MAG: hypothetical protein SCJ93_10565 [Bacillota bacterium]|nr:hypothetical protein [Bacillota bacterium]
MINLKNIKKIILVLSLIYIVVIGYKIIVFNTPVVVDESTRVELKDIGLSDEIINLIPKDLINSLKNNSEIVKLKDYDINKINNEYLGTLVFEVGPPYSPPYLPPYSKDELHDLVITFFKRTNPKLPLIKDRLKYSYDEEDSLINSFLFIDGISYFGKNNNIKKIANRYDIKIPGFISYEGYLYTMFKDKNYDENIDYVLIYKSTKDRVTKID